MGELGLPANWSIDPEVPSRSINEDPELYRVYGTTPSGDTLNEAKNDKDNDPILSVSSVNYKIESNSVDHRTDEYEMTAESVGELVVRRGQTFLVIIETDRPFQEDTDDIRLVLSIGKTPSIDDKSLALCMVSKKPEEQPKDWHATMVSTSGKVVDMEITSPADCAVGIWSFNIETLYNYKNEDKETKYYRYVHEKRIYLLFNPWCPADQVYMTNTGELEEYVLKSTGLLASGNSYQIGTKEWNFGQFEEHMLICALWLLDNKADLGYSQRGDPVIVSRRISAICNVQDDGGVLVGNWSGNYSDGNAPTNWVGSVNILQQYWRTKQPVRFAQCWVFSAVVTTVCRALGIPCRSVTNFDSAHDTNGSTTIDYVIDSEGEPIAAKNGDSVWNFHVWNDVWMARPDLDFGLGGWQAVDATPQETSEGVYCAGPSPLAAIKKGMVNIGYDTKFIFAEVNADRVKWQQGEDGKYVKLRTGRYDKRSVGTCVKTKKPHHDELEDITLQYKFKEGSEEERAAVFHAAQGADSEYPVYEHTAEDVSVTIVQKDNILIGNPFDITVILTNESKERRVVSGNVTAHVVRYNGVTVDKLLRKDYDDILLGPGEKKDLITHVTFDEYFPKLVEQAALKESVFMKVSETRQIISEFGNFRLRRPDITLEIREMAYVNTQIECTAILTNPLPIKLTGCIFHIEGPRGLQKTISREIGDVAPGEDAREVFLLTPKKEGTNNVLASFECKEFADIAGDLKFVVEAARTETETRPDARDPLRTSEPENRPRVREPLRTPEPPARRSNVCNIL